MDNIPSNIKPWLSKSGSIRNKAPLHIKNDWFIFRARKIHGNKYLYSKLSIPNTEATLVVTCPIHGDFITNQRAHLAKGRGCQKCSGGVSTDLKHFIEKSIKVHGDTYDYSLCRYYNAKEKMKIICKKHGIFEQNANNHLSGNGCPICANQVHDILYLWNLVGTNLYKYGITTSSNKTARIKRVAKAHNVDYRILVYRKMEHPEEVELIIKHNYSDKASQTTEDGKTEILELTVDEAEELRSLMEIL